MATRTPAEVYSSNDFDFLMHKLIHRQLLNCKQWFLYTVVTGRMGTGKSALVNSIVGKEVAEEGKSPGRIATKVTKYEKKV